MGRTVGLGIQSFEKIRENDYFYVDKTGFIKEWWEKGNDVTLITRPPAFWKDAADEYGGAVFLNEIRRTRKAV